MSKHQCDGLAIAINDPVDRVRWACLLEATAPKAGNVHPGASFADLDYLDFVAAAEAVAPILGNAHASDRCGDLTLRCIEATRQKCQSNVNLGIVLLLAPLVIAEARRQHSRTGLQEEVVQVLAGLDREDADAVYRAIRLAKPGGLQAAKAMDVSGPAPSDLMAAMRLSQHRDRIALQYATGFKDLLGDAVLEELQRELRRAQGDWLFAIRRFQLTMLASSVDSLIARKCSVETATAVMRRARDVLESRNQSDAWQTFDCWLRADGNRRNPGTTADLIAAATWVALGEHGGRGKSF